MMPPPHTMTSQPSCGASLAAAALAMMRAATPRRVRGGALVRGAQLRRGLRSAAPPATRIRWGGAVQTVST